LAAITAGKHVLCEKPFTINVREAEEVIAAVKPKVFISWKVISHLTPLYSLIWIAKERIAVWTRFFPLVLDLKRMLHEEKVIGNIQRMTCDFSIDKKMESLPATHRYKDVNLGGGALLDIGVYPLMWSNIVLDRSVGSVGSTPEVSSTMVVIEGVDHEDVVVLKYPKTNRIGILTTSLRAKGREEFLKVEGSKGVITVSGPGCSLPLNLKIQVDGEEERELVYNHKGMGFYFEADSVARDILKGGRRVRPCRWRKRLG
jgi:dihydrodiol dehydrogenase / D-xylose 1-dehydrogenase (NADP)